MDYLMWAPSKALVASSWFSNCTKAASRQMLNWQTFPYCSKYLFKSTCLSKLNTKRVLVGENLVGVPSWRRRHPCTYENSKINNLQELFFSSSLDSLLIKQIVLEPENKSMTYVAPSGSQFASVTPKFHVINITDCISGSTFIRKTNKSFCWR